MTKTIVTYEHENAALTQGYRFICGVDEAGRGPLAGPVYAAAVILPQGLVIDQLNDSKKLSEKKREDLFDVICAQAIAWAIASASAAEIDEHNVLGATFLAMRRAVDQLLGKHPEIVPATCFALIDGNRCPELPIASQCLVGGDGKSPSIAAASILAKVSRDRYMRELDKMYPQYGFAKHKGYGTQQHTAAIHKYGKIVEHRESFRVPKLKEHE
ncbi:MAG: ribonuclease HII [Oscillospiraceae bacterium]|nr:ribonuclease HII [Oscillospiraceae bacterium]